MCIQSVSFFAHFREFRYDLGHGSLCRVHDHNRTCALVGARERVCLGHDIHPHLRLALERTNVAAHVTWSAALVLQPTARLGPTHCFATLAHDGLAWLTRRITLFVAFKNLGRSRMPTMSAHDSLGTGIGAIGNPHRSIQISLQTHEATIGIAFTSVIQSNTCPNLMDPPMTSVFNFLMIHILQIKAKVPSAVYNNTILVQCMIMRY